MKKSNTMKSKYELWIRPILCDIILALNEYDLPTAKALFLTLNPPLAEHCVPANFAWIREYRNLYCLISEAVNTKKNHNRESAIEALFGYLESADIPIKTTKKKKAK